MYNVEVIASPDRLQIERMYYNVFKRGFAPEDREPIEYFLSCGIKQNFNRQLFILRDAAVDVGILVATYFHKSESAFVDYLVVMDHSSRMHFSTMLFNEAQKRMQAYAHSNGKKLKYFFAEHFEIPGEAGHVSQSVRYIWSQIGLYKMMFPYTRPGAETQIELLAKRYNQEVENAKPNLIPSGDVMKFLIDYSVGTVEQNELQKYLEDMKALMPDEVPFRSVFRATDS